MEETLEGESSKKKKTRESLDESPHKKRASSKVIDTTLKKGKGTPPTKPWKQKTPPSTKLDKLVEVVGSMNDVEIVATNPGQ